MIKTTFKNQVNQFKHDAFMKFESASVYMQSWWKANSEWAIIVIPAASVVAAKAIGEGSKIIKSANNTRAARINACTVWDPRKQVHYTLKHPMSGVEANDYARLTNSGMSMYDALQTLRLI